ncbi:MAG: oxidoreductase, partial [Myxococcota bacterium]
MSTPPDSDALIARVSAAAALLEQIVEEQTLLVDVDAELRKRLMIAAGRFSSLDKDAKRAFTRAKQLKRKRAKKEQDEALLDQAGIRELRRNPIFLTPRRQAAHGGPPPPSPGTVSEARTCYVCQAEYHTLHHFYDQLC